MACRQQEVDPKFEADRRGTGTGKKTQKEKGHQKGKIYEVHIEN
jgi:hypothetical protein